MAEISLDHFFDVVCHESRWRGDYDRHDDLLRNAIIHFVTASSQLPRLRRAAIAWQPSTPAHRKFKKLMLAEDLQPLAKDQLTAPVVALMRTLQDWLRTNWYRKGEIPRHISSHTSSHSYKLSESESERVIAKTRPLRKKRALLAQKRAMNVEQRALLRQNLAERRQRKSVTR
jgi:hypothetical protein